VARPLLFDTDIASDADDALALALVLACRSDLELVAVTTVGRNGATRAAAAASLLGVAGRLDVEVCTGAERPVLRDASRFNWFGHEQACIADGPRAPISDEPVAERIVRAARDHPGLQVLLIGPLTNMAHALALDPGLPERLGGVTIMGGHVREVRIGRQICEPGIDYNLCADPEASLAVLGSGCPLTLVTADVTLQTWLRDSDVARLSTTGPLGSELARQVALWKPVQQRIFPAIGGDLTPDNASFLHDPLTVLALIDDTAIGWETLAIVPTIQADILRTLEAPPGARIGTPMRVATTVDATLARERICQRLLTLH
jgi:purine nucleosidase